MDLDGARALVAAAISNGLAYSSYSRLDSPKELFDQLFAEVDGRLAEGLEAVAWWQACRQYRPSCFGNEIAVAVATLADADLPGLVSALDLVKQSRLQYELTNFALRHAPQARYVHWLELAQTPRLVGLGVAAALQALIGAHTADVEAEKSIEDWATSLRGKQPEARSRVWWQLAALVPMTGPMHRWSAIADALWEVASREIQIGEHHPQAYAPLVERLRSHCDVLNALFARIAAHGSVEFRADAASALRQDFLARLQADEWSLPSLEDDSERGEYLPAVGWAIAHDVQTGNAHNRWWEIALSAHLIPVPRWRTPRGWRKRCGLILLSACCAAHHLLQAGAPETETFCNTLLAIADIELPALIGPGMGAFHPLRFVPLALVSVECRVSPTSDGSRLLRLAGLTQSAEGVRELVKAIEATQAKQQREPAWLAELKRMHARRAQHESELFPDRQSKNPEQGSAPQRLASLVVADDAKARRGTSISFSAALDDFAPDPDRRTFE
jgi:hypothetical protein